LNILDLVIIAVLLIGFVLGYKDGFVRKVIGLIGMVTAIYLAIKFSDVLGELIESAFEIEYYLAEIIGGMVIFLLIILIFSILKRVVHPFDKVNSFINQLVGGIVGMLQVLFFLSAVFFLLRIFDVPDEETGEASLLYTPAYLILPRTIDYIQDYTPESKQIIDELINQKDSL
jgi:membrane protein required for colicin V production